MIISLCLFSHEQVKYITDANKCLNSIVTIFCSYSLADSGVDLDLRCIENVLTDYDSQHLQEQEST